MQFRIFSRKKYIVRLDIYIFFPFIFRSVRVTFLMPNAEILQNFYKILNLYKKYELSSFSHFDEVIDFLMRVIFGTV